MLHHLRTKGQGGNAPDRFGRATELACERRGLEGERETGLVLTTVTAGTARERALRGENTAAESQGDSVSSKRIDEGGSVSSVQDTVGNRHGGAVDKWRSSHRFGDLFPSAGTQPEPRVRGENFVERGGDVCPDHRRGVESTFRERLDATIAAVEEVDVSGRWSFFSGEVSFDPNPAGGVVGSGRAAEIRPATTCVDDSFGFDGLAVDFDSVTSRALHSGCAASICACRFRLPPKGEVQIKARDTPGGFRQCELKAVAIHEHSRVFNLSRRPQERVVAAEEIGKNLVRFRRHEFSANAVTGQSALFAEKNAFTGTSRCDCGGTPSGAAADNGEIVAYFHAMIPMRKR